MGEGAKNYRILSTGPVELTADWEPYSFFKASARNNNPRCSIRECTNTARYKDLCLPCYAELECRPSWKCCQITEDGEKCGRKLHSHKMCQRHADRVRRSKKR